MKTITEYIASFPELAGYDGEFRERGNMKKGKEYFVSRGNNIGHNSDMLLIFFSSAIEAENAGWYDFPDGNFTVWFIDEDGEPEAI